MLKRHTFLNAPSSNGKRRLNCRKIIIDLMNYNKITTLLFY